MKVPTNREALKSLVAEWPNGGSPDLCEWDPLRQMPARLKDPYHGVAVARMIAKVDGLPCHVCDACCEEAADHRLLEAADDARQGAPSRLFAPWTDEEVASLNAYQERGGMHSFTCAYGCGPLVATRDGWKCLCGYIQEWAWSWMARSIVAANDHLHGGIAREIPKNGREVP